MSLAAATCLCVPPSAFGRASTRLWAAHNHMLLTVAALNSGPPPSSVVCRLQPGEGLIFRGLYLPGIFWHLGRWGIAKVGVADREAKQRPWPQTLIFWGLPTQSPIFCTL